jgi:cytochrome c oxidase subunit 2
VIHNFFVPNLRIKQDAVPGLTVILHFTAIETGKYEVACAELCGLGHYKMKSFMDVFSQEDYEKWLTERAPSR